MEENIKIEIKLSKNEKVLANANVTLNTTGFGWITIKDFRIWKSSVLNSRLEDYVNIKPLAVNSKGRWILMVFIEKVTDWYNLENLIYKEYLKKKDLEIDVEKISREIN